MKLTIPFPPSVNSMYRQFKGRTIISAKGREYKKLIAALVKVNGWNKRMEGRLHMEVTLYPPDRRKRDLDNSLKGIQDSLQEAKVFIDDSQIDYVSVQRGEVRKPGCAEIEIRYR
jgi:crossover junction endodeoxyribonuclease RusA